MKPFAQYSAGSTRSQTIFAARFNMHLIGVCFNFVGADLKRICIKERLAVSAIPLSTPL
jgi:hypothetical protein